jgi:hypothetical protein
VLGQGFCDLIAYDPISGAVWLVEAKQQKGKLTPDEERFAARFGYDCGGPYVIVRSAQGVADLVGEARGA